MSVDSTENDAEIARILTEEYDFESNLLNSTTLKRSKSYSPMPSKKFKTDDVEKELDKSSVDQVNMNENCLQIDEDSEMAYILQIEEIILSENEINDKTMKVTDVQLEKTHADMTKALQPTEQTDLMGRIFGMFITIQTRYANYQAKNQVLIDQIQKLSIQLYPTLISFQTQGNFGIPKVAVPGLALGLITNVLQGKIKTTDAKQILINMLEIWKESNIWYEFFEQLVYILVAVTVPSFAQGAMRKIMGRFSSSE